MLASLLLTWLVTPVPVRPLQETDSPAQEKAAQEKTAAEPKARTTVLHLAGGRVLRMLARESGGTWEVKQGSEWKALPAGAVERAADEHELLEQAKKLESGLGKNDGGKDSLVRRVAYADWLVEAGLQIEALRQLDRVLAADPDQSDALALLARAEFALGVPSAPADAAGLEDFFRAAAPLTTCGRELAVQRLASAKQIAGLRPALAQELSARSSARRAFAALVLRRMFAGSEAPNLLGRAVLDSSPEVRTSAALALKAFADPGVIEPVVKAASSKYAEVRVNAVEALAKMDYREAVQPLYERLVSVQSSGGGGAPHAYIFNGTQRSYVQDFDVEVAQGAAIADPVINILVEGSVLDAAVIGVNDYEVQSERATLRRALSDLTGAHPGDTTAAWQRWWKEHGDEWKAGAAPPKTPTSSAGRG